MFQVTAWARARLQVIAPRLEPDAGEQMLPPSAVQRGLRLSIAEGALASVHIQLTGGAFLTGFALLLGANAFQLGLLGGLPFIGRLCQFVGAYLEERLNERRRLVTLALVGSRVLWLPIALLPFVAGVGAASFWILLLLIALSQVLSGIGANAWLSWMSDLVPAKQRGAYFGFRNTVSSVTAMASAWLAGGALDMFLRSDSQRIGYLLLFSCAALFAVLSGILLWRQPEPPLIRKQRMRLGELIKTPLRHASFRAYCLAGMGWAITTGISAPFFNAYGIETLQMSMTTLATMAVVTSSVTLVSQPLVGRLQDRYGDKSVLVASVLGVIALPWGWVLSAPNFLLPLWITNSLAGVFWPGVNQGLFNLLIARSATEGRGAYLAAHGVITGAGTFIASLLGGALGALFATTVIDLGPIAVGGYAVLFALSSLGRAVMAYIFWRTL